VNSSAIQSLLDDVKLFGSMGAEVTHQRAGDQLAALVTSHLRGRTGVGGLEEAGQHAAGRLRRGVVQHHVELIVEAEHEAVQTLLTPERRG
jgi:hypothetical protein